MSHGGLRADWRVAEWRLLVLLGVVFALAGCHASFKPRNYANPEALFRASLAEYQQRRWENAQLGFEQLSNDLSARDPLLPQVLFYLALTHEKRSEYLLASQAYLRVSDTFADDTLAPAAVLGSGRSLQMMWRKSTLDPENGQKAATTFRMLLATYPASKEAKEAKERVDTLDNWFAKKDYDIGIHYMKVRKAPDPAIIYFKDVVKAYPSTATARLAWFRLREIYTKLRWKDDASDVCGVLWTTYPGDAQVKLECGEKPPEVKVEAKPEEAKAGTVPPVKKDTLFANPGALARPGP